MPLEYDDKKWRMLFQSLRHFQCRTSVAAHTGDPGKPRQRQQDVLDSNAQVWLLKSAEQVPPENCEHLKTAPMFELCVKPALQ